MESKDQVAHVRDAFLALDEMYQTPYRTLSRLPDVTIVNYQEEIEKTRLVGRLYYTLIDATHWLEQTTQMLEANQDKIICGANRDTTQFRYLRKRISVDLCRRGTTLHGVCRQYLSATRWRD